MIRLNLHRLGLLIIISFVFTSCKLGRFVVYNFADIKDYKIFPSRSLKSNVTKFKFNSTTAGIYPDTLKYGNNSVPFDKVLEDNKTVAFLIIKNVFRKRFLLFRGRDVWP